MNYKNITEIEKSLISDLILEPYLIKDVSIKSIVFQDQFYKITFEEIRSIIDNDIVFDAHILNLKVNQRLEKTINDKFTNESTKAEFRELLIDNSVPLILMQLTEKEYLPNIDTIKEKCNLIFENWQRISFVNGLQAIRATLTQKTVKDAMNENKLLISQIETQEEKTNNKVSELAEKQKKIIQERMMNKSKTTFESGFLQIDELCPLTKTEVHVIGARPAMGKTAMMLIHALCTAYNKSPVMIFSLEMSKERLLNRFVQYLIKVDSRKIDKGELNEREFEDVCNCLDFIKSLDITIEDDIYSIEEMHRHLRKNNFENGLILADYLQISSTEYKAKTKDLEIAEITKTTKRIAKSLKSCFVWLSQLSRECEKRMNKRPIISDLLYSGGIERDADVVRFLYRDEYYLDADQLLNSPDLKGVGEDICRKNRHGSLGVSNLRFEVGSWISDYMSDYYSITNEIEQTKDFDFSQHRQNDDDIPF